MKQKHTLKIGIFALILFLFNLLVLYQVAKPAYDAGILLLSRRVWFVMGLGGMAAVLDLAFCIGIFLFPNTLEIFLSKSFSGMRRLRWLNLVIFLMLVGGFVYLLIGPLENYYRQLPLRILFYVQVVILAGVFLKAFTCSYGWSEILAFSGLLVASCLKVASFLPDISNNPFSMGWSEGSQHYYASLFLSQWIYGQRFPLPVLHPGQYLLLSLPFVIRGAPLWVHRLWEALLWLGTSLVAGFSIKRFVSTYSGGCGWILVAWVFLFLFIGPVYYHLLLAVILILLAFNPQMNNRGGFVASTLVVLVASVWAGICRVNWFPVPGILAASLYFLQIPRNKQSLLGYLIKPIVWVGLGTIVASLAYLTYIYLSGNPPEQFASSFTSRLLWNRLLPNATYRPGILPAILLVSIPFWLIIICKITKGRKIYDPIRQFGLFGMILVLFSEGLIVSTKIGGASNLHNMDAYMVLLMLIIVIVYFDRYIPEAEASESQTTFLADTVSPPLKDNSVSMNTLVFYLSTIMAMVVPVFSVLLNVQAFRAPDLQASNIALDKIQNYARQASQHDGQVLFISERQLLTFQAIKGVPLIPEYEKVFFMEMAMSGNKDYLNHFFQDIENHRFAVIVTEPVNLAGHNDSGPVGE